MINDLIINVKDIFITAQQYKSKWLIYVLYSDVQEHYRNFQMALENPAPVENGPTYSYFIMK